jgi:MarR family transcriptional regulator for hemolysin
MAAMRPAAAPCRFDTNPYYIGSYQIDGPPGLQSLGLLLHDAARLLKREFERESRQYGLTLLQWKVLAKLADGDGLSQATLAGLVEASPMTLSDIVERLESRGLVTRAPDPADSRAKLVSIEPAARVMVGRMRGVVTEVYDRALSGIASEDRAALTRALTRITENLADGQPVEQEA